MKPDKPKATWEDDFRAIIDIIIPADDYPAASMAGVDTFIFNLWDSKSELSEVSIRAGVTELTGIAMKSDEDQAQMIKAIDQQEWFKRLCELVAEGYYADPGNGANPDAISWQMIGYRHGLPERPDGPPVNQNDAIKGRLWL